jgi:mannose-6-phosphate isomerase-like protein (cupin superfamily)
MPLHAKYTFRGYSGYLVASRQSSGGQVALRHSALVPAWSDADVHTHGESEEYYLLLHGEFRVLVGDSLLTLRPMEMLMVRSGVPHAIAGGDGPVEHFGIRAPAPDDRQSLGEVPAALPPITDEEERELRREWGCRMPLGDPQNRNCWLTGLPPARFYSPHLLLAYLDFPTEEAANAGIGTRHRLHLHQQSWEYYTVLDGTKTLRIEDDLITVQAGETLQVPPGIRHTLHARQAPYRGFTFRVPILPDKVEF